MMMKNRHSKIKRNNLDRVLSISAKLDHRIEQKIIEQVLKDCSGDHDKAFALLSQLVQPDYTIESSDAETVTSLLSVNQTKNELLENCIAFITSQLRLDDSSPDRSSNREIYKEIIISNQYNIIKSIRDIANIFSVSIEYRAEQTRDSNFTSLTSIAAYDEKAITATLLTSGDFLHFDYDINDSELMCDECVDKENAILKNIYDQIFGGPDLQESQFMIQDVLANEFHHFCMSKNTSKNDLGDYGYDSVASPETVEEVAYKVLRNLFPANDIDDQIIQDILFRCNYDVESATELLCNHSLDFIHKSKPKSFVDILKVKTSPTATTTVENSFGRRSKSCVDIVKNNPSIASTMFESSVSNKSFNQHHSQESMTNINENKSSVNVSHSLTSDTIVNVPKAVSSTHDSNSWLLVTSGGKHNHNDGQAVRSKFQSQLELSSCLSKNNNSYSNHSTQHDDKYWREIAQQKATDMICHFTRAREAVASGLRCNGHHVGRNLASYYAQQGHDSKLYFTYAEKMCAVYTLLRHNKSINLEYAVYDVNSNHYTALPVPLDDKCGHLEFAGYNTDSIYADPVVTSQLRRGKTGHVAIDLHGLNIRQALRVVKSAITYYRMLLHTYTNIKDSSYSKDTRDIGKNMCRLIQLRLVVGRGNHSERGVARLRPSVISYLQRVGVTHDTSSASAGEIIVTIQ